MLKCLWMRTKIITFGKKPGFRFHREPHFMVYLWMKVQPLPHRVLSLIMLHLKGHPMMVNPDGFPDGWVSPNREESALGQTTPTKHLISCRNYTIFSTFNARTLGPLGRLEELGVDAKSQNIDVIAIQEHRFYHPNDILKYHTVGSYQLVTSSASKKAINSTVGGVGILLSPKASDNLLSIEPISPRIFFAWVRWQPENNCSVRLQPNKFFFSRRNWGFLYNTSC